METLAEDSLASVWQWPGIGKDGKRFSRCKEVASLAANKSIYLSRIRLRQQKHQQQQQLRRRRVMIKVDEPSDCERSTAIKTAAKDENVNWPDYVKPPRTSTAEFRLQDWPRCSYSCLLSSRQLQKRQSRRGQVAQLETCAAARLQSGEAKSWHSNETSEGQEELATKTKVMQEVATETEMAVLRSTNWQASCNEASLQPVFQWHYLLSQPPAAAAATTTTTTRASKDGQEFASSFAHRCCSSSLSASLWKQGQEVARQPRLQCKIGDKRNKMRTKEANNNNNKKSGRRNCSALSLALLLSLCLSLLVGLIGTEIAPNMLDSSKLKASNLSVLCNSRCQCLILATKLRSQPTNSVLSLSSQTEAENVTQATSFQDQLIALSDDYSLDYEHAELAANSSGQQMPPNSSNLFNLKQTTAGNGGNGDDLEANTDLGQRPQTGNDRRSIQQAQSVISLGSVPNLSDQSNDTTNLKALSDELSELAKGNNTNHNNNNNNPVANITNPSQIGLISLQSNNTVAQVVVSQQQPYQNARTPQMRLLPFGAAHQLGAAPSGGSPQISAIFHPSFYNNNPAKLVFKQHKQQQQRTFKLDDEIIKVPTKKMLSRFGLSPDEQLIDVLPLDKLDLSNGKLLLPYSNLNSSTDNSASIANSGASQLDHSANANYSTIDNERVARVLADMFIELDNNQQQALNLRNNNIQFEQWTEIYALLAMRPMRGHLFQLDLSHNSLVKLGVTFTGYIEHHLMLAQQALPIDNSSSSIGIDSSNNTLTRPVSNLVQWPFGNNTLHNNHHHHHQNATTSTSSSPMTFQQKQQQYSDQNHAMRLVASLRHQPVLGDGRLFNLVQSLLRQHYQSSSNSTSSGQKLSTNNFTSSLNNNTTIKLFANNNYTYVEHEPTSLNIASTQQDNHQHESINNILQQQQQQLLLQLRSIDLSHNKLKWLINDQFRAIRKVQSIRLDHNKIRFIHQQAFNGLESLKYLNLNSNRLQTIYIEQFQTNYNLLALSLRANYLAYLRAGSFATQSNLRRLDLSRNKFTVLSNNAFVGLESLELLNCSSNQFAQIPSSSLHPMKHLKQLDFSQNQFNQLAPGTFFHLPIEELLLNQNNQLMSIERGAFWDLPNLSRLSLMSNPILMSINSQAFVGASQKLQQIDYDDCPMLDGQTKQMLDNITLAATSRSLAAASAVNDNSSMFASDHNPATFSAGLDEVQSDNSTSVGQPQAHNLALGGLTKRPHHHHLQHHQALQQQQQQTSEKSTTTSAFDTFTGSRSKLFYSVGSIVLVLVALNLVLKYTSTRRYLLDSHQRRRRVYNAEDANEDDGCDPASSTARDHFGGDASGGGSCEDDDQSSSLSGVGEQRSCVTPGSSITDGHRSRSTTTNGYGAGDSSSLDYPADSAEPDLQVFALCERPHKLLRPPQQQITDTDIAGSRRTSESSAGHLTPMPLDNQQGSEQSCQVEQQVVSGSIEQHHALDQVIIDGHADELQPQEQLANTVILTQLEPESEQSDGQQQLSFDQMVLDCPDCRQQQQQQQQTSSEQQQLAAAGETRGGQQQTETTTATAISPQQMEALNLIHNQLVAAAYDYGHANCAHFYQSLGPALQFAEMTASFVNQMEHHFY